MQAVEWSIDDVDNGAGFLWADFALIVSKNRAAFGCSATHEKRYVTNVLGSETFQRRYENFTERLKVKHPEVKLHLDAEHLKGDLLVFALFIRCCNGPVSDSIIVVDALRDAFVGHGDYRPVFELFEDALAAGAVTTPAEQAAIGVTPETNSQCLRDLQTGLEAALKRLDETGLAVDTLQANYGTMQTNVGTLQTNYGTIQTNVGTLQTNFGTIQTNVGTIQTSVNTMQTNVNTIQTNVGTLHASVDTLQADIEVLQLSAIPESNRLYVCGFVDQHFNIEKDFPQLLRLEVLGIFGSLVCQSLGEQGLRHTVAKEPRGDGSFRNVYDNQIHLQTFEECRALLPGAVKEAAVRKSTRALPQASHVPDPFNMDVGQPEQRPYRSPQALFDWEMGRLTPEQQRYLFRDFGDKKLAEAATERARMIVLENRRKSVWFIFHGLFQVEMRMAANQGQVVNSADVAARVFKEACDTYEQNRQKKADKESAKEARRASASTASGSRKRSRVQD